MWRRVRAMLTVVLTVMLGVLIMLGPVSGSAFAEDVLDQVPEQQPVEQGGQSNDPEQEGDSEEQQPQQLTTEPGVSEAAPEAPTQEQPTDEPPTSTDDAATDQATQQEAQTSTEDDVEVVVDAEATPTDAPAATEGSELKPAQGATSAVPTITARAHVQKKKWMSWQSATGAGSIITIGTTGKSLRLEAFQAKVSCDGVSGGIAYAAHVQKKGWMGTASDGATGGVTGKSLRTEAIRAWLTGDMAGQFDLCYRVHVSGIGWMAWARNGADAGTAGYAKRVEAIQFAIVPKDAADPTSDSACGIPFTQYRANLLEYASYVKSWQGMKHAGQTSGTTGKKQSVKAIQAHTLPLDALGGSVQYRAHVSRSGWTSWVGADQVAGNQSNTIEAVSFRLTGDLARFYDVWYRAHVSKAGWLGWAKNGEAAGSTGAAKSLEAYQVKLVPKGKGAPGSTANHVVGKAYFNDAMTQRAQGYGSPTSWLVMIDNNASHVGIYRGHKGSWKRVKYWIASCGKSSTPTVRGTYSIGAKGYVFGDGYSCYYWTSFYNDYLFHSVLYHEGSRSIMDGTLGSNASHGCVRLAIENAKWLQDNVPGGTTVVSY